MPKATGWLKYQQRGEPLNTMKYILAALIGVNAVIGLLIIVLNHQL